MRLGSEDEQAIMKRTDLLVRKPRTPEENREWIIRSKILHVIMRSFASLGKALYGESIWAALFSSPEKKPSIYKDYSCKDYSCKEHCHN